MKQYFIILCLLATILYSQEEVPLDELLNIVSQENAVPTEKVQKLVDDLQPKLDKEQRKQINGYMNEALKNYDDILNNIDSKNTVQNNIDQKDNNNQTTLTEEQSKVFDSYINEALKNYDDIIKQTENNASNANNDINNNADTKTEYNAQNNNIQNKVEQKKSLEKNEIIRKKLIEQLKKNESVRQLLLEQLEKLE